MDVDYLNIKGMIDKIVITLAETGFVNVNIGDVHFIHSNDMKDVLLNVSDAIKKLAYFPKSHNDLSAPITREEFLKKYNGNKKR